MKYLLQTILLLCSTSCLFAEGLFKKPGVDLTFSLSIVPDKAVGMIISSRGVVEKTGIDLSSTKEGIYVATVPLNSNERSTDTFATAIIQSESSDIYFTPLKSTGDPERNKSYLSLPMCKETHVRTRTEDETIVSNVGALQSLMDIRKIRRDFAQLEISNTMRGDFLEQLQRMEVGFGLTEGTPLSAELKPHELTQRLQRILTAIRNYEANK